MFIYTLQWNILECLRCVFYDLLNVKLHTLTVNNPPIQTISKHTCLPSEKIQVRLQVKTNYTPISFHIRANCRLVLAHYAWIGNLNRWTQRLVSVLIFLHLFIIPMNSLWVYMSWLSCAMHEWSCIQHIWIAQTSSKGLFDYVRLCLSAGTCSLV